MTAQQMSALRECLSPISTEEFIGRYFQKQALLVVGERPQKYRNLLSFELVDQIVACSGLQYPGFRLVKNGSQIDLDEKFLQSRFAAPNTGLANSVAVFDACLLYTSPSPRD